MWMCKVMFLFFAIGALFLSCDDTNKADGLTVGEDSVDSKGSFSNKYLVSATFSNELSAEALKALATDFGQTAIANRIKYNVRSYKVLYNTSYNGKQVQASGLMYVPVGLAKPAPIISLQHGTTFLKKHAPSVTGEFYGLELFASAGFISILPDFIGYGASDEIFHPYYDQKHSAYTVIDMIKGAKEYLNKEDIKYNDQLFLAGYSEGGYITLAAAKEIELNPQINLTVTAVAAGAGGYDLNAMLNGIATNSTYTYPSYLAFVLKSYFTTYNWDKSFKTYFSNQYARALDTLMTGHYDGGFINSRLTKDLQQLFEPAFYDNLKAGKVEPQLKEALNKNSITGWKTSIPLKLYHGTKDEIIPYQNSEITLQSFKKAGSTNVMLIPTEGGGHGSSFLPMLKSFVPWFEGLKK